VTPGRRHLIRLLAAGFAGPMIAYAIASAAAGSSTVGLAAAGAVSLAATLITIVHAGRLEPLLMIPSLGYIVGCAASLLLASSLPLKLHEAAITFLTGLVLLTASGLNRPPPLHRVTRLQDPELNRTLGALVGSMLALHALVHVGLALTVSTSAWLVASKAASILTLLAGVLAIRYFVRHRRRSSDPLASTGPARAHRTGPPIPD
jgi:intracellular septation protein A